MLPESANEVNIEASSSNNNSNSSSSSSGNDSSMTSSTSSSETTQPPQNASKTTEEASTTDKANSRIDYEKLEALTGVPRVHDKLAFQVTDSTRQRLFFFISILFYSSSIIIVDARDIVQFHARDIQVQSKTKIT